MPMHNVIYYLPQKSVYQLSMCDLTHAREFAYHVGPPVFHIEKLGRPGNEAILLTPTCKYLN